MVAQLERRGLVERAPQPEGARTLSLRLTGEGLAELRQMSSRVNKINETITGVLSPEEIDQLNSMLRRCAIAVEQGIVAEAGSDNPSPEPITTSDS